MELKPFIKWAGGKRQILNQLILPDKYNNYYEPFIGGGSLLFAIQPKNAIINDINSQLINCYKQIKNNVNLLINEIQKIDKEIINQSYFLQKRDQFNQKIINNIYDIESAALFLWINKHCFNGLYRVNKKGLFNVGFNKNTNKNLINYNLLINISNYLQTVQIENKDFEDVLSNVKKNDFVYIDSPYIGVSSTANFTSYSKDKFTDEDHQRLADLVIKLHNRGAKLLLSNSNNEKVYKLYKDFSIIEINTLRNINCDSSKRTGKDVIIKNY